MKKILVFNLMVFLSINLNAKSIYINSSTATIVTSGINVNFQGICYTLLNDLGYTYSIVGDQINVSVCYYVTPLAMNTYLNENFFIPVTEYKEYKVNLTIYSSASYSLCDYSVIEYSSLDMLSNIDFNLSDDFILYPNPSQGLLHIDADTLMTFTAKIYDLNGKLLKISDTSVTDISELNNGIYLVKINTKERMIVKKLLLLK